MLAAGLAVWLWPEPTAPGPAPAATTSETVPTETAPAVPPPAAPKPVTADRSPGRPASPPRRVRAPWSAIDRYPDARAARDALLPAAEAGDVHAMVALARSLNHCRSGASDPELIAKYQRAAQAVGEPDAVDVRIDGKLAAYCNLPTAESVSLYRRWLLEAADRGEPEALVYAIFNPPLRTDWFSRDLDPAHANNFPEVDELDRWIGYARQALGQGEIDAAIWLTRLQSFDGHGDGDPMLRYENAVLLDELARAAGDPPQDYLVRTRRRALSPALQDIARSRALARIAATPQWIDRPILTPEQQAELDAHMARAAAGDAAAPPSASSGP